MTDSAGSIIHELNEKFFQVMEPGKIFLEIHARESLADYAEVQYRDGGRQMKASLKPGEVRDGMRVFAGEIVLERRQVDMPYHFILKGSPGTFRFPSEEGKNFPGFTGYVDHIPSWAKGVVWYQVFPERFRNGNPRSNPTLEDIKETWIKNWRIRDWGKDWYAMDLWEQENFDSVFQSIYHRRCGGDLTGIIEKLDYIQQLGIGAIYLNPVFRGESLHKYDGSTFHHVDETFGPDPEKDKALLQEAGETHDPKTWIWTGADKLLLELVDQAHCRGIKVIIDGVFNHSSRNFFAFADLLKNKQESPYKDWYSVTRWDDNLPDGFEYEGWFGHHYLPEFARDENNLNPHYKKYLFDITRRWMAPEGDPSKGVDGWRLDVAFCVPHGFWREWRGLVKSINPEAYITGEVIDIAPEFLRGDEFDALMNYPFAFNVSQFFIDQKDKIPPSVFAREMLRLGRAYPPDVTGVMMNLLSSHDTPRLRTLIVNPDCNYRDWWGFHDRSKAEKNPNYRIDRGDPVHRAIHRMIVAFQMTWPGAPMIYYGDELGMTGANDPDCRKPMLWDDIEFEDEATEPRPGMTHPGEKNQPDKELLCDYRTLIAIRNNQPALRRGDVEVLMADDESGVLAFARVFEKDRILAVFNNSDTPCEVSVPLPDGFNRRWKGLMDSSQWEARENFLKTVVSPMSFLILKGCQDKAEQ